MIKLILLDIDGVITDGKVEINCSGEEYKRIDYRDVDAIFELKRIGYQLGFITGESTKITDYFNGRFQPDFFYAGRKDKDHVIYEIMEKTGLKKEEICFVGDGINDISALRIVGLGVCPNNALQEVKLAAGVCLETSGGEGCIRELLNLLIHRPESNISYFEQSYNQHMELFRRINSNPIVKEGVIRAASGITECYKNKGRVLICGNGGSAADAQHIAAELTGRFYMERKPLDAEAITTNTSTLTAIGNDYSYDLVFARQVEAKGKKGDLLIVLSTSGSSKNIIEALRISKEIGMTNVALIGEKSNAQLTKFADIIINAPSSVTPRIQEAHIFIGHVICEMVEAILFGR